MRVFEEFPETAKCPVCGKNTNSPCVLIGIYGTQEGHNIQAEPFHLKCLDLVWYKKESLVAMKWK